jgi:polyhydroxyalkanoate synthase
MQGFGIWNGRKMAAAFNLIDTEHYYWPFQHRYYWQGEPPIAHELVHWLQDYTHTPEKLFSFYMRSLYRDNILVKPNALMVNGIGIDFANITCPVYCLGLLEDHLTPAEAAFANMRLFANCRFVLGEGGHVAGTLSTATQKKLGYFTEGSGNTNLNAWQASASYQSGSWWLDWLKWFAPHTGNTLYPKVCFKSLGEAPGEYVKTLSHCRQLEYL